MPSSSVRRPSVRYLTDGTIREVVDEAKAVLWQVGVRVEHEHAVALLAGAGVRITDVGRAHVPAAVVDGALETAPDHIILYDRNGENPLNVGGHAVHFDPGSAAIRVFDYERDTIRPSTTDDCVLFAKLTDALPVLAFQSTCVVPTNISNEKAGRCRLGLALMHGRKPIITGIFAVNSFEIMKQMLVCVRGSQAALREKPLAVFDCCPSPPLRWSELSCSALLGCAETHIPAELISMPMTGATSPVTLLGAVVQHTAENLAGLVMHQLASPGAPVIYGGCASAFDMRSGTTPLGAIETMMINAACAEVGKSLGLPTHAYMALSDSKTLDYQAGLETGSGAILAALSGINIVSGPGMLDFVTCQSLEKLVLDHEACRMALRYIRGIERREPDLALDVIKEGVDKQQFLSLAHTRKWHRHEIQLPGPTVDRQVADVWQAAGSKTAAERAHEEVCRLLSHESEPLEATVQKQLHELMNA
jgi:trimethylamine--corrinoid protein Co-methyltransferase